MLDRLLVGLNHIARNDSLLTEDEKRILVDNMKENYTKGKPLSYVSMEETLVGNKGIEINIYAKYDDCKFSTDPSQNPYRRRIKKENNDDFKQWDNTDVSLLLKQAFVEYLRPPTPEKKLQKFRNWIARKIIDPASIKTLASREKITEEEINEAEKNIQNKTNEHNRSEDADERNE